MGGAHGAAWIHALLPMARGSSFANGYAAAAATNATTGGGGGGGGAFGSLVMEGGASLWHGGKGADVSV